MEEARSQPHANERVSCYTYHRTNRGGTARNTAGAQAAPRTSVVASRVLCVPARAPYTSYPRVRHTQDVKALLCTRYSLTSVTTHVAGRVTVVSPGRVFTTELSES
jgi:hypothetical protein